MASNRLTDSSLCILTISKLLDGSDDIKKFKIAIKGLNISGNVQHKTTFSEIFGCLTDFLREPNEAITFTYHVLKALNVSLGDQETIVESSLIDGYNLRTQYPAVDCRLVVMEFLSNLKEIDYKSILDALCRVLKVNSNRFDDRWELAEELFSAGFISDPSRDITQIYQISALYNFQSLFSEYCQRHGIEEPAVDSRFAARSGDQKLDLLLEIMKTRSSPGSNKKQCILCIVLVVLLILCGLIVTILLATVYSGITQGSVNITDYSLIALNNGFSNYYRSVSLSLNTNDDTIAMDIYESDCSKASTVTNSLPPQIKSEVLASYFKRHPYNYNGGDFPLNGLKDSYIDFNLSASSNESNPGCLRIHIFNNVNLYNDATDPGEDNTTIVDGTIVHSRCLPVSSNGTSINSSWRYTFDKQQYVYAAVDVGARVTLNGVITANVVNYTLGSVTRYDDCHSLTKGNSKCEVDICGNVCGKSKSESLYCVYVRIQPMDVKLTSQYKVSYTARLPTYKFLFFMSLCITVVLLVILVIVPLVGCCCYAKCKGRSSPRVNRSTHHAFLWNRQHSNNSDQLLLQDTDCQ